MKTGTSNPRAPQWEAFIHALVDWSWTRPGPVLMLTTPATERLRSPAGLAEVTGVDGDFGWLVPLKMIYGWDEWKSKWHLKLAKERKKKVLYKPQTSCWQIPRDLQGVCVTWLYFPSCLLDFVELLTNTASCNGLFYFFLPKKLNLFSRSLSFPSLLRMVTPPPSAELGEMGGMVMARLSARGPPGESPAPDGTDPIMERIQELISDWSVKKTELQQTLLDISFLILFLQSKSMSHLILCLEQVLFSIPQPEYCWQVSQTRSTDSPPSFMMAYHFLPELEDVFPLLVVVSHLTHGLSEADGHLSVVWNAIACAFSIFIEAKASFS